MRILTLFLFLVVAAVATDTFAFGGSYRQTAWGVAVDFGAGVTYHFTDAITRMQRLRQ